MLELILKLVSCGHSLDKFGLCTQKFSSRF